jgi:protein-tyrosine phosphatase
MAKQAGLLSSFEISSAATSSEEIGNPIYPPMRVLLENRGLDCSRHRARRVRRSDYDANDLIIGMDAENRWDLSRLFHGDPDGKLHNLNEYAGLGNLDIADPWYTRDFSGCLEEMERACYGLFEELTGVVFLDFRHSADIPALYEELRSKMAWEPWYGESLDALHDILTGLPHRGSRFVLLLPDEDAPAEVRLYAERIRRVIEDSEERAAE